MDVAIISFMSYFCRTPHSCGGSGQKEIPETVVVSGIFTGGRYRTRTYDLPHVKRML